MLMQWGAFTVLAEAGIHKTHVTVTVSRAPEKYKTKIHESLPIPSPLSPIHILVQEPPNGALISWKYNIYNISAGSMLITPFAAHIKNVGV